MLGAYTRGVTVPSELRSALPATLAPERVRAAVRAPGSPGSLGGETWLLDVDGALAVLTRSSIFDDLAPVALAESGPVEQRGAEVEVRPADGAAFVVRPGVFEVDATTRLLAGVEGLASVSGPTGAREPAPAPVWSPPIEASASFEPAAEPEPSVAVDFEPGEPEVDGARPSGFEETPEEQLVDAIAASRDDEALALARTLARREAQPERWHDLVAVLELIRAGDRVAALMWSLDVRQLPVDVHDAVLLRLAGAFEGPEPLLAWAALRELIDDEPGEARRAALVARLGSDEATLRRTLAERAREFFRGSAEAGDPLAQRGLAHALFDLDELAGARQWIARIKARDPLDYPTRELELDVLALEAITDHDDRELVRAYEAMISDFSDRAGPLVRLADHLEYDDPVRAIDCLRRAQALEFDELVLRDLIELLTSSKRYAEVIREAEAALTGPHADELLDFVRDDLRARLRDARVALGVRPETALAGSSGGQLATPASAGAVVGVTVLVIVAVIGMVIALLF